MLEAIIVILAVAADQVTKHLTDLYLMPLGTTYPLLENILHLTSAHNTGAVFGILPGWRWAFLALTLSAIVGIVYILIKKRSALHLLLRICLALVLAGAAGNFIDRAVLGYVRDMMEFRFMEFAIFNVADCCVTVGAALLMCDLLFGKSKHLLDDGRAPRRAAVPGAGEKNEAAKAVAAARTGETPEKAEAAETAGPEGERHDA